MEQVKVRQEYFEMAFNVDDGRLSVEDLITYLENTNELFKSINDSLYRPHGGIAFSSLSLDVLALDKGSFKIKYDIIKKSLTENKDFRDLALGIIASMIGGLALNLFYGPQINTIVNPSIRREIMKDEKTIKSVVNIINTALSDERINGVSITYEPIEGQREKVTLSRETLKSSLDAYHEKYGRRVWLKEKVEIEILKIKGDYMICEIEGDHNIIDVDIDDLHKQIEIVSLMLYQKNERWRRPNLEPGDILIVDVECILEQDEITQKTNIRYSILKVYGFKTSKPI